MKTYSAKPNEIKERWLLIDANGKTLGRLSSKIASYLKGKDNPWYTPHANIGAFVVVINAKNIVVTGTKEPYYHHTGYPGGLKKTTFEEIINGKFPERVIQKAVKGMIPKNSLGRSMLKKLKVYAGSEHPHTAQQPELTELV